MLKVLIVDDDINTINCLSSQISWEHIGCELVATACDGIEGYEMAVSRKPDIIICDLVMPGMDGGTLCKRIFEILSDVVFIFLSAYEDFATAQLALQYHVYDYILKPLNRQKLDNITSKLQRISLQREKSTFYRSILHDPRIEERIILALRNGDVEYFEMLFEQMMSDISSLGMRVDKVRDIAYRLNSFLNRYLKTTGKSNEQEENANRSIAAIRNKVELVDYISERYFLLLKMNNPSREGYYLSMLKEVMDYIDLHFGDADLNASSVAAQFGYSPNYLSSILKRTYGINLIEYIIQKRLEKTCELLKNPSKQISDISKAVGYQDRTSLARIFRKHYGMSPSEYRTYCKQDVQE